MCTYENSAGRDRFNCKACGRQQLFPRVNMGLPVECAFVRSSSESVNYFLTPFADSAFGRQDVREILEELLKQGIFLTRNGRETNRPEIGTIVNDFDIARILLAMKQIRYLFEPSSSYSLGSYGAKHMLERDMAHLGLIKKYIANGDFIVAMILSGYQVRFNQSPNAVFKAKKK